MSVSIFGKRGAGHLSDPSLRGYHVVYRENEVNHCPAAVVRTGTSGASRPNAASAARRCR